MLHGQEKHGTLGMVLLISSLLHRGLPADLRNVLPGHQSRFLLLPFSQHSRMYSFLFLPQDLCLFPCLVFQGSHLCFLSWSPTLVLEMLKPPALLAWFQCWCRGRGGGRGGKPHGGLDPRWQLAYFSFWMKLNVLLTEKYKPSCPAKTDIDLVSCSCVLLFPTWISHIRPLQQPLPDSWLFKALWTLTPPLPSLFPSEHSCLLNLLRLLTNKLFNLSEPHRAMNIQRETSCGCTHSENASSFLFLSLQRIWENYFLAIRNQVRLILEAFLPWALLSHACIVQSIQWAPDGPVSFPHPSLPHLSPCQPHALHTCPVLISFSAQPEPREQHLHT